MIDRELFVPPLPIEVARDVRLQKGPNIVSLPDLEPLDDPLEVAVALVVGDDLSTDEILPAGSRVLPYRSNVPKIAEFAFRDVDSEYPQRARDIGPHAIVAGRNYGQGSSREHAALAPRHLGLRLVIARSFARIHAQNLVNFGVLPLLMTEDAIAPERGDRLRIDDVWSQLENGDTVTVRVGDRTITCRQELSDRQLEVLQHGSLLAEVRARLQD